MISISCFKLIWEYTVQIWYNKPLLSDVTPYIIDCHASTEGCSRHHGTLTSYTKAMVDREDEWSLAVTLGDIGMSLQSVDQLRQPNSLSVWGLEVNGL